MARQDSLPLPEAPALGAMAAALRDAGQWAEIVDRDWRYVYMTDELRVSLGGVVELVPVPIGAHYFGTEAAGVRRHWRNGPKASEDLRSPLRAVGGWLVADTRGGRDELHGLVDPALRDVIDELPLEDPRLALAYSFPGTGISGGEIQTMCTAVRVHDASGQLAGTVLIFKPEAGMAVLGAVAANGDLRHFERMQRVAKPARRPAAILFADLEASTPLARRLSTAGYFRLGRLLVRAADQCVIDAGGLVGRHVGDGVAAFFLAETAGSESAAARACIVAARAFRGSVADIAKASELRPEEVVLRFGLHWGTTLYVGQVATRGRTEVAALGDEVNEAARIEACASGGRALASKALVERLEPDDAGGLELDPDQVTYTALAQLPTATEKARRDAPAIAVCEI